jgi:large repetitive protein
VDFDNDGKLDLIAGDTEGNIWFFKNIGTKTEPKLAAGVKLKADGKDIVGASATYEVVNNQLKVTSMPLSPIGVYSKPHVVDWDGDGLLDLVVGDYSSKNGSEVVFYRNIGTATEPKFASPLPLNLYPKSMAVDRPSPYVVDWDGDGKRDMLIGTDAGKVLFLRNTGTNAKPVFAAPEEIKLPGMETCIRTRVCAVDWNNDGKLDLLVGNYYSTSVAGKPANGGHVWLFLRK